MSILKKFEELRGAYNHERRLATTHFLFVLMKYYLQLKEWCRVKKLFYWVQIII